MSRPKKIKWEEAKSVYIANRDMSLKQVALQFLVSYSYLREVAQKEGWVKEKESRWKNAEQGALEEVEGSIKDLITRHAKVARFLQVTGIKRIQKRLKDIANAEENPELAKRIREIDDRTLMAMVSEGLKAERELYPKHLKIEGGIEVVVTEASDEVKKAANEALKKQLTSKPRKTRKSS